MGLGLKGYMGKVLVVDMTAQKGHIEKVNETWFVNISNMDEQAAA